MNDSTTRARKPRAITNPAIDQTAPAFLIMQKVGGLSAFAALIKRPTSTCYRWLESGLIPANEQTDVLVAYHDAGIPLDPAEFVRLPSAA